MADEETIVTPAEAKEVDVPTEDPWDALTFEQQQELVEIEHSEAGSTSEVTRAAYLATWKDLGWRIKGVLEEDRTTGQLVRVPDPNEPVIVQRTDGVLDGEVVGVPVADAVPELDSPPESGRRR